MNRWHNQSQVGSLLLWGRRWDGLERGLGGVERVWSGAAAAIECDAVCCGNVYEVTYQWIYNIPSVVVLWGARPVKQTVVAIIGPETR